MKIITVCAYNNVNEMLKMCVTLQGCFAHFSTHIVTLSYVIFVFLDHRVHCRALIFLSAFTSSDARTSFRKPYVHISRAVRIQTDYLIDDFRPKTRLNRNYPIRITYRRLSKTRESNFDRYFFVFFFSPRRSFFPESRGTHRPYRRNRRDGRRYNGRAFTFDRECG